MEQIYEEKSGVKEGIMAAIPIVAGYIPIAMTFGILSKTNGIPIIYSFLFSVLVYAGASQFMALNLIIIGTSYVGIVLTTLLVNFRHFLMSASIAAKITKDMNKYKPIIAFGMTDEVFSVASFSEKKLTKEFLLSLQLTAYLSWIFGTLFGYLIGNILPDILKDSMGIALYAMFVAILIPELKKSKEVFILVCLSAILNTVFTYFNFLPQGWNFIVTIILVSAIGSLVFKDGDECNE